MGIPDLNVTAKKAIERPELAQLVCISARTEARCVAVQMWIPQAGALSDLGLVPITRHSMEEPRGQQSPTSMAGCWVFSPLTQNPSSSPASGKLQQGWGRSLGVARGEWGGWDFPQEITGGTLAGGWGEPVRSCYIMPQ